MSIIRMTEGDYITEIEKGWIVFTNNFSAYAGDFSHFTAKDVTVLGNPSRDKEDSLIYFEDGWWSSDAEGYNRITEAYVGDTVYFNIKMKNVKENDAKVDLQLYDDDGWFNPPDKIDIIEIKENGEKGELIKSKPIMNNKVSFSLKLNDGLIDFIEDDVGNEIELYFECGYKNEKQIKLPYSELDYLKVFEKEVLITVIVELLHSSYTIFNDFISAIGLAGHSAMAIGDRYFDYGPDNAPGLYSEREYDVDFNKDGDKEDDVYLDSPSYKNSPGRPWWGEMIANRLGIEAKEVKLINALDFINLHWRDDMTNIYGKVYKSEFYVKESEANKMLKWWEERYKHLKVYSVYPWTGEQCTTTVKTAIQEAFPFELGESVNRIPDITQRPSGLLDELRKFRSTSYEHFGEPANIIVIKEEAIDYP